MLGHILASEVDPNFKFTSNHRRSLSSTSQLAHLNYELLHHFCTFREIIPREARAEGPSVARLINQSGRRPERSESRANSSEKYIYIHIYLSGFIRTYPKKLSTF